MGKKDHAFYKEYKDQHTIVGTIDGGACLSDHESVYREHKSCSYRWQGLEKAGEALGLSVYNDGRVDKNWHVGRSGFRYKSPKTIEKGFAGKILRFTGRVSNDGKKHAEILNFTNGSVPYANQVHHVLPTGVLRASIEDVAKDVPRVKDLLCKGLLKEKYNQNFKDNMLILPETSHVAAIIGLPKHLGSHDNYSKEIAKSVNRALAPYEKIAEQIKRKEKHDQDDPESLKDDLLTISNTVYSRIIARSSAAKLDYFQKNASTSLDDLPETLFADMRV